MTDQFAFLDPTTSHPRPDEQDAARASGREPVQDAGEDTYRGVGRLAGRRAIVTGAASGIGRAVAIAFAREGADLVLSHLPEEQERADEVVALAERAGRRAISSPGDLTDEAACERLVRTAVNGLGGLEVLVNVAGTQQHVEAIEDLTSERFDRTLKTNVYGLFWLCRAAAPHLPPGGSIIATSSVQAYSPNPAMPDYAGTKAFINAFCGSLAGQLGPRGVRVNVVAPGAVWTALQQSTGQPEEALQGLGAGVPLGRSAQPVELAPAYVFLASAEAGYVTGETLNVHGGMSTP